ncbi:unnamed protein product [Sphagnum jensenii]|uniref:DNA-directed DNA polymerase n=1 Tax=Sphagnum jensenii TaxID=128206 RepID=A0ABP0WSX6_9BRYO
MEGGKSRLDQIFPARKVRNSGVFLTATDSDALSVEKKKKQQKKSKSPGRRGSLEGFIVRDRQGNGDDLLPLSNAVGGEKRGGASEVTESSITLAKPAVSLQWVSNNCLRSTTEIRLQRCEAPAACAAKSGSERTITTEEAGEHGDIGAQPRPWKVVQKAVESVTAIEEVARTAGPVDLQVAKQNKGDTLEDDDTRKSHQLTQFANEFLAICCSSFTKGLDLVENIQPDRNDALKTPTWKEKGPSLPPLSKSPEETNQQRGHDRNGTRSRYRTPKSRSKSMAKHEEGGGLCQSPHSSSTKKTGRGSSSSLKSVGWVYHSSLFSPGDAFWDEAIEAADGLLASNVEELQVGGAVDMNTKHSGSTHDVDSCQYEERTDSYPPVEQVLEPAKDTRSVDSSHSPLVAESRRGFVGATVLSDVEGIVSRGFSAQVSQMDVSPLPVRHFDFTSQTSPQNKSIDELLRQDASQSNFQCRSRSVLAKESLNERGTGTSQQTRMRVDDVVLTGGNRECLPMGMVNGRSEIEDMQQSSAPTVAATSLGLTEQVSAAPDQSHVDLSEWLPPDICAIYIKKGLRKLYPWQVECLQLDGVLQGRSLVYCASTSAGKSLVAEVLMLRRILSTGKKAFLVLPYVALCSEKAEHLESLLEPLGKHVRGFYGAQGGASLPKDTSVAVCTIEKANLLINKLLEEGRLSELSIIVIDELHMVGDRDRGYLLELLLTKLRYAAGGGEAVSAGSSPGEGLGSNALWNTGLQIVGMSATMPNVSDVATWLQAAFYETDFRPVPLEEFMKIGNKIHKKNMELVRTIRKEADLGGKDPDHVVELCHEVVREGHSVLLFCSSRKGCETSARHIAKFLPAFTIVEKANMSGPKDGNAAVEELRKSPAGLDPVLAETLPAGVAYHHAGLTVEERDVVEACFKSGVVRVLVATSTLAAGVNLPARRVVFRQPKIGRDFIDGTRYRQMAGRAGRAGIDTKGESILICKPEEAKRMEGIMKSACQPLQSCLADDKNGMMRALLEVVAGGVVQSAADVQRYVRCTLLNATQPFDQVVKAAQDSLRWLCHQHLLSWNSESQLYTSTPLGRAAFGSSLSPEESLVVFEDLVKAREGFVLASDLHLLYEVTPTYVDLEPDWTAYYQHFVELSPIDQVVANRVGVVEPFLLRMAHGVPIMEQRSGGRPRNGRGSSRGRISPAIQKSKWCSPSGPQLTTDQMLRVCKRFYVALMLSKLVQEVSLMEVCAMFKVPRGTVQGLQESAGRFSGMVAAFCERLGWSDMEGLVSKFQSRVSFGVKSEIVELTDIPFVKAARARALFKAGLRSVQAVAEATLPELFKALYDGSNWPGQGGTKTGGQHWAQIGIARKIKNGARQITLDRAEEARKAAFSAFQALGFQVPAALAMPFPPATDDALQMGAALASSVAIPVVVSTSMPVIEGADTSLTHPLPVNIPYQDREESKEKIYRSFAGPKEDILRTEVNGNGDCFRVEGGHSKEIGMETVSEFAIATSSSGLQVPCGVIEIGIEEVKHEQLSNIQTANLELQMKKDNCLPAHELLPVLTNYHQSDVVHMHNGSDAAALFSGSLVAQGEDVEVLPIQSEEPFKGPVDVDKIPGGFNKFWEKWNAVEEFAFDLYCKVPATEVTTKLIEVEGMALCWRDSPVYYVSFSRGQKPLDGSAPDVGKSDVLVMANSTSINAVTCLGEEAWSLARMRWEKASEVFLKAGVKKVAWDVKGQLHALTNPGFHVPLQHQDNGKSLVVFDSKPNPVQLRALPALKVQEHLVDVRVAAWLLWPDEESAQTFSLEQEVKRRLPGEVAAAASRAGRWMNQMGRVAHNGCCRRAAQVWALHSAFWKLLQAEGLHQPLMQLEMPLVKVLADMETWGVGVDMEACRKAQQLLNCKLRALEVKAQQLAGMPFSLSIPGEVAHVLYQHLQLPVPAGCKGKQHPSTDKHALDLLRDQHPIAEVIREHRRLSKLLHGTLGAIAEHVQSPVSLPSLDEGTRRDDVYCIFGCWLQTSTATGRLSMENPNLQCVEHSISFTIDEESSHTGDIQLCRDIEVNARQLFVPLQEGWVLLSADYSQIEIRLMAHFSGDPSLISLLSKPAGDVFRMLAAQWTGLSESAITEQQREHTKRLVYGLLYGMGVNTLSEHLQCPLADAQQMLDQFKATFPAVAVWLNQAVQSCRQNGYVKTLCGRKRYLDKINHGKWGEKAKAERQAVNSICQGSAADLIKMAMIKVHNAMSTPRRERVSTLSQQRVQLESPAWPLQGSCRLLLQIHDELVLEVDKRVLKEVASMLRYYMEGAATLKVPLRAKLQVGSSWGSLLPYDENLVTTASV